MAIKGDLTIEIHPEEQQCPFSDRKRYPNQ